MLARALSARPDLLAAPAEMRRADRNASATRGANTKHDDWRRLLPRLGTNAIIFSATVPLPLNNRNGASPEPTMPHPPAT